jgi:hypothetical protein
VKENQLTVAKRYLEKGIRMGIKKKGEEIKDTQKNSEKTVITFLETHVDEMKDEDKLKLKEECEKCLYSKIRLLLGENTLSYNSPANMCLDEQPLCSIYFSNDFFFCNTITNENDSQEPICICNEQSEESDCVAYEKLLTYVMVDMDKVKPNTGQEKLIESYFRTIEEEYNLENQNKGEEDQTHVGWRVIRQSVFA